MLSFSFDIMAEGTIKHFENDDNKLGKSGGLIDTEAIDKDVIFFIDDAYGTNFDEGQKVKFDLVEDSDIKKPKAVNVRTEENITNHQSKSSENVIHYDTEHDHNIEKTTKKEDNKLVTAVSSSKFADIFGDEFLTKEEIKEDLKSRDDHKFDYEIEKEEVRRFIINEKKNVRRTIEREHTKKEVPVAEFENKSIENIDDRELESPSGLYSVDSIEKSEQIFFTDKTIGDCSDCDGKHTYACYCDDGLTECYTCDGEGKQECKRCDGSNLISCPKCDTGETCSDCQGTGETECSNCGGKSGDTCGNCNGDGHEQCSNCRGDGKISCDECDDEGSVDCTRCEGDGVVDQDTPCPNCNATGKTTCPICESSGFTACQECHGDGTTRCGRCGSKGVITCTKCSSGVVNCTACDGGIIIEESCYKCNGTGEADCPKCDESGMQECSECGGDQLVDHYLCDGSGERVCEICGEDGQTVKYTEVKIMWDEDRYDGWKLDEEESNEPAVEVPTTEDKVTLYQKDFLKQTPYVEFEYKCADDWHEVQVWYENPGVSYNILSRPTREKNSFTGSSKHSSMNVKNEDMTGNIVKAIGLLVAIGAVGYLLFAL